jgi:hypothetical protein
MPPRRFSQTPRTFSEARCTVLLLDALVRCLGAPFYNAVRRSEAWCAVLCRGAAFYAAVRAFINRFSSTVHFKRRIKENGKQNDS